MGSVFYSIHSSLEQAQLAFPSLLSPQACGQPTSPFLKTPSPEGPVTLLWIPGRAVAVPKDLRCPPWLRLHSTGQSPRAICLVLSSVPVSDRRVLGHPCTLFSYQNNLTALWERKLPTIYGQLCPGTWHTDTGQTPSGDFHSW